MSNVLQRLAQRGAAPAAVTGLVPLQMRPRSRFDTAAPGIETAPAGLSTPASPSGPFIFTPGEARPVLSPRAELREAPAARAAAPQALSAEPVVSTKAELPSAPLTVPAGKTEPSDPMAAVGQPEGPHPAFAAREPAAPEPARPPAETAERLTQVGAPFGAEAIQAEPSVAEPPPLLSIGRLEVQFVQPPAPPAPSAPVRRGSSGFADYARIRRGSPR
jgi:hypothetical protein